MMVMMDGCRTIGRERRVGRGRRRRSRRRGRRGRRVAHPGRRVGLLGLLRLCGVRHRHRGILRGAYEVLAYGSTVGGLFKSADKYPSEVRLLRALEREGVRLYQVPGLHAKGVVTPLAIITGSTNLTHGGLYAQAQNANYFAHDHPDYPANRTQLLSCFRGVPAGAAP